MLPQRLRLVLTCVTLVTGADAWDTLVINRPTAVNSNRTISADTVRRLTTLAHSDTQAAGHD